MEQQRLENWYNGDLDDDELTVKEIEWLQEAVFNAVTRKVLERPGVHTFPDAKGIH